MMRQVLSSLSGLTLLVLAGGQVAMALAAPSVALPATERLAQALVQINDLQVESTETGLQVVIAADGQLATPTQATSGNALVLTIANATLTEDVEVFQPAEDIAVVQATALADNRIEVVITGRDAVPEITINNDATGLVLGVTSGIAQANTGDEALRITVTGEEGSRYVEPTASTGTRTDTPLRDIPQSIQVIPREVLEDQGVVQLEDALRNVSGITPSEQDSRGVQFNVRGFNSAAVLRDGFRVNLGTRTVPQDLANIEQIEVLKGPASILFGALEPGGVINLVTEQPLSEPFYKVALRLGNYGLIEPSLDISGPLTDDGRLLYRLNALYRTEDGFRDFDVDSERFFIAPVVSWQISDRTDLTVSLEYIDEEKPVDFGLIALGDGVADIPFDRILGEPDNVTTNEYLRTGYQFEHRFSDNWRVRNAFYYINRDNLFDSTGPSFLDETTGDLTRFFSLSEIQEEFYELQTNIVGEFATGSIDHTLLSGVDLFRRDNNFLTQQDFLTPAPINIFDPVYGQTRRPKFDNVPVAAEIGNQLRYLSVYLQDQIAFFDNFILLAGIRYDTFEQEQEAASPFLPELIELNRSESAFTPRVGLVYQPTENVSLFASYSRSFTPNSPGSFGTEVFEPEEGEQFEIGVKTELLDGRLSANLAYFDITQQNVVTTDPINPLLSVLTGEERSRGVELDVAGEILPGWNIVANYAYIDAEITEDNSGLEGNRKANVPENNFNLWSTYDVQSGSLEGLGFGLGVNYVGDRFGDNANSYTVDDYFLTNAAISYQRDNWQARLNFRNLFDVDYIESTASFNRNIVFPGQGFTVFGSFSVEF
ncbi:MAG: TonB-dependent siderophore receptor [Cyanobacteria bacterium P01_B01_bin.77]